MHLLKNTLLQGGKYKIVRFISAGGFGCTYEAEHVMLHKKVAIKEFFVKDFCNRDEQTSQVTVGTQTKVALVSKLKKKFVEEAVTLSSFNHPNIVSVSDVFEENGTAYYVMDYIEGDSLHEKIKAFGSLPEFQALKYIYQVANALSYVHARHRLHLDIKPGNIMIDGYDNAILIDFGASKQYDEENGENTSTLMGKTPGYAPLEQMGNNVGHFTPATDIYSLGATLYKLLTGQTPPEANLLVTGDETLVFSESISKSVRETILKSMEVRKVDRIQTIPDFLKMLSPKKSLETILDSQNGFDDTILDNDESTIFASNKCYDNNLENATTSRENFPQNNSHNGHEFVDLGLSVKWATCNIGADYPEEMGTYYSWAEIDSKNYYDIKSCQLWKRRVDDISGDSTRDAAQFHWGSKWRIPTKKDIYELISKCKWEWTTLLRSKGYKIIGPNGNSIFLPASGTKENSQKSGLQIEGFYWSSTPDQVYTQNAFVIYFNSTKIMECREYRHLGHCIRPVWR